MVSWFGVTLPMLADPSTYREKPLELWLGWVLEKTVGRHLKIYILTVPSLYIFANLMYIKEHEQLYKVHGEVHSYNTRQRNMLTTTYHRLKRCQDGPGYISAKLFNALPIEIRNLECSMFKSSIKTFLTINCFYSLDGYFNYKF
nr:unnamed protein product [Callosobruchus analis]